MQTNTIYIRPIEHGIDPFVVKPAMFHMPDGPKATATSGMGTHETLHDIQYDHVMFLFPHAALPNYHKFPNQAAVSIICVYIGGC